RLLRTTEFDLPQWLKTRALSLAPPAVRRELPGMPPPANPVVIGDSGLPFGSNLVALPCHNESCPCQPTVKLSPTQRLPSLSNIGPAARAIATAVEFERQNPGAGREIQIRHVRHRPQPLALPPPLQPPPHPQHPPPPVP